ncbi:netrin-5 isoform a precursor [Mus musculus]|uniref:Netrin-5 n=1 Tax=Mus musculus TaxID=10090 RepID=NET5_MOUSE|nr:netrin-5 isoform a precursor [Mus musculus]Q3UQ22.2 RecName: Full=Netrin-5; AltName: Full=Netrin-1-like protein; Flags: Precursor [Mus musculus]AAI50902.1 Netrin 5 [Mus musculus]|eukprot:NP_001028528.2 netrin-5 isoform a precursor [Mus musculus]
MTDYRTLFSSPGAGSTVTTPITLSLLLLLSQATSDPCYDPGGRPRFCLPPVTQLVGKAAAPCSQTCALPAASPGPACNSSLTLDLDGSFLLTSVTLRFCTAGPPALVLSAAWATGGPWRPLWRRPAWPGALGGPKKVTFHSPPGPKTRIVASYLRVEFGGKAGLVTTGVRGRCQCHGHAARCATRAQPPRCRCRHHTTGPGCESCRPSHRDWPWRPATPQHPHPCLPCQCHPIGATGGMCNQTSGQCSCKLGVTGLTCNRCGPGYQQSRSPRMPCQRIPEATTTPATTPVASRSDPQCQGYCNVSVSSVHMSLQRYCQQDYVLHAQVSASSSQPSEAVGPEWWRLAVHVLAVFKQRAWPVRRGGQEAWVPRADLICGCLRLRPGADYLLLGRAAQTHDDDNYDPARLILNRHGLALPWRPRWARPLRRLQQKERGGACRGLLPPTRSPGPRN